MNKKMKRALVTMMSSSLVAIPIGFTTAFTSTSINSGKFIFAGRFFHNKQEALAYMLHHNMLDINEQKVVGDTSHAFANVEKGLINKYVLPDYTPSHMQFAWFNKGGGITRDYEAAKNSYYSLGDSSVRYFDGFGGSFPNQSSAQRSMRQWIATGASGYYEVPFFQGNDKTHINPLNAADVEAWKNNLQSNVDQLIKENFNSDKPKYKLEFVDKQLVNHDFISQLKQAPLINGATRSGNNLRYESPMSSTLFQWWANTFHLGRGTYNDEHNEWWFGFDHDNQRIHFYITDNWYIPADRRFSFLPNQNFEYNFPLNNFNNLITMSNVQDNMPYQTNFQLLGSRPSLVSSIKQGLKMPDLDHFDEGKMGIFNFGSLSDLSSILKNNGISNNLMKDAATFLKNKVNNASENIAFNSHDFKINNLSVDRHSDHGDNYGELRSVSGNINIHHSLNLNNIYSDWSTYVDNHLKPKSDLINNLIYLNQTPNSISHVVIKNANGAPLFEGDLKMAYYNNKQIFKLDALQVAKTNHDVIKGDTEGKELLENIDSLITDLKNKQDNQTYREVLEAWDRRCQVSGVDFTLRDNEVKIKLIQNLRLIIYSLKNLINKYKNSEGLLQALSEEIGKINVNDFVFLENSTNTLDLIKSAYTINSIASVNGSMISWNTPTVSSEFQKDYDRLYNSMPAAVEVLYKPNGEQYICDDWMFDTEEVMKYNFLRDINVRRDDSHIYIDGYNEPFSNVVTSIYHLSLNGENTYFDTFSHLRDYVYQYISANSTEVRD